MAGRVRSYLGWLLTARRQAGQSVVELALIMALATPLVLGSVDLGRAYFDYDMLGHAANEGARRASFDSNKTNIITATRTASGRLNIPAANVTVTCYVGTTTTTRPDCVGVVLNDTIEVRATSTFTPITLAIARLMPGGVLTLAASARRTYQ